MQINFPIQGALSSGRPEPLARIPHKGKSNIMTYTNASSANMQLAKILFTAGMNLAYHNMSSSLHPLPPSLPGPPASNCSHYAMIYTKPVTPKTPVGPATP